MKEYHTKVDIKVSRDIVWGVLTDFPNYKQWNPLVSKLSGNIVEGGTIYTTIVPLKNTFAATLLSYKENREIIWQGKRVAKFLLAGKHYYRLKNVNASLTTLEHGEYFTGILSYFISNKLLKKMEDAFIEHNTALKNEIENA